MLFVDIPTRSEIGALAGSRKDACVSIYVETTPLTQKIDRNQTEFRNLARKALEQLAEDGLDKRRHADLNEALEDLAEDDDFWRLQANSLAVFATPDGVRSFRLANDLAPTVQVSDRFHITPLLRAVTFAHTAFVLALSENDVRLVEISPDLPPVSVRVDDLPRNAANAVGTASVNSRSASGRIQGSEGQNVRLRQYARQVDSALRPVLSGRDTPLILAATGRLAPLYHSVNSYPDLLEKDISDSPDRLSDEDIAAAARPILDDHYARRLDQLAERYHASVGGGLAISDASDAARAATFGAVDTLIVDMDAVLPGSVDEESGVIDLAGEESAGSYDILDEIARRTLAGSGRVLAVRKEDLPAGDQLAAILRYPLQ